MFDLLIALCIFNQVACRQQTLINYAVLSAQMHNIDPNKYLVLISCESRFNEKNRGDYRSETGEYMANGLLQYWENTYTPFAKKYGIKKKYWDLDPFAQIDLSVRMIRDGEIGRWRNCGIASGLYQPLALK